MIDNDITNVNGAIADNGFNGDIALIDYKMALIKK